MPNIDIKTPDGKTLTVPFSGPPPSSGDVQDIVNQYESSRKSAATKPALNSWGGPVDPYGDPADQPPPKPVKAPTAKAPTAPPQAPSASPTGEYDPSQHSMWTNFRHNLTPSVIGQKLEGAAEGAGSILDGDLLGAGDMVGKYGSRIGAAVAGAVGAKGTAKILTDKAKGYEEGENENGTLAINAISGGLGTAKDLTAQAGYSAGGQPKMAAHQWNQIKTNTATEWHNDPGQVVVNGVSAALSVAGLGEAGLAKGAELALSASGKLDALADAASAAGDTSKAARFRAAAGRAKFMAADMKAASVGVHRAATGGALGDHVLATTAKLAQKYFPGTIIPHFLYKGLASRVGLRNAAADYLAARPGLKAAAGPSVAPVTPDGVTPRLLPEITTDTSQPFGQSPQTPIVPVQTPPAPFAAGRSASPAPPLAPGVFAPPQPAPYTPPGMAAPTTARPLTAADLGGPAAGPTLGGTGSSTPLSAAALAARLAPQPAPATASTAAPPASSVSGGLPALPAGNWWEVASHTVDGRGGHSAQVSLTDDFGSSTRRVNWRDGEDVGEAVRRKFDLPTGTGAAHPVRAAATVPPVGAGRPVQAFDSTDGTIPPAAGGVDLSTDGPEENPPPFYSYARRVAAAKLPVKGRASDFLKALKGANVHADELASSGLGDFLASKGDGPVTRQDVLDHIDKNGVQLGEDVRGGDKNVVQWKGDPQGVLTPHGPDLPRDAGIKYHKPDEDNPDGRYVATMEGTEEDFQDLNEAKDWVQQYADDFGTGGPATKYSSYQLPGGTNYQEHLVTVPDKSDAVRLASVRASIAAADKRGPEYIQANKAKYDELVTEREQLESHPPPYTSAYWDREPNIIGHVRTNDRMGPNGEKILHVEEIQSDHGQDIRKYGVKGEPVKPSSSAVARLAKARSDVEAARGRLQAEGIPEDATVPPQPAAGHTPTIAERRVRGLISDYAVKRNELADAQEAMGPIPVKDAEAAHVKAQAELQSAAARLAAEGPSLRNKRDAIPPPTGRHVVTSSDGKVLYDGPDERQAFMVRHGNPASEVRHDFGRYGPEYMALDRQYQDLYQAAHRAKAAVRETAQKLEEAKAAQDTHDANAVPDMPFRTTWPTLLARRVMHRAAAEGYDGVSWSPGHVQDARYDLSKHVDSVEYRPTNKKGGLGVLTAHKEGEQVVHETGITPEKLSDYVGKDVATKLLQSPQDRSGTHVLDGDELRVGTDGMQKFYGDHESPGMLHTVFNKIVKPHGESVGSTEIGTTDDWSVKHMVDPDGTRAYMVTKKGVPVKSFSNEQEANSFVASQPSHALPVPYVKITPAMRHSLLHEGQPLFGHQTALPGTKTGKGGGVDLSDDGDELVPTDTPAFKRWFGDSKVVDPKTGEPLVVFHGTSSPDEFTAFQRHQNDVGMHFGTEEQAQDRLAYKKMNGLPADANRLMPVYLSIKNPLRLEDIGNWDADSLEYGLYQSGKFTEHQLEKAMRSSDNPRTQLVALRQLIRSKGYDGIVYKNEGEVKGYGDLISQANEHRDRHFGQGKSKYTLEEQASPEYRQWLAMQDRGRQFAKDNGEDSYIAFEPNQIKSAVNNVGTFDPKSNRIDLVRNGADTPSPLRFKVGPDRRRVSIDDLLNPDGTFKAGFPVMGDRTRVGKYTPIHPDSNIDVDLQGGPQGGQMDSHYGKAAWASDGPSVSGKFANRIRQGGHLGYVTLQAPEASFSNADFFRTYALETKEALKRGLLKESDLNDLIGGVVAKVRSLAEADAKKKAAQHGRTYTPGSADPFKGDTPKTMDDLVRRVDDNSLGNGFVTRARIIKALGNSRIARATGMPYHGDVLQGFNDPQYDGVPTGSVVSVVHFDPEHPDAVHADDLGVPAHGSYRDVHPGVHLGELDNPIPIYELYADELKNSRSKYRSLDFGRTIKKLDLGIMAKHKALEIHPMLSPELSKIMDEELAAWEIQRQEDGYPMTDEEREEFGRDPNNLLPPISPGPVEGSPEYYAAQPWMAELKKALASGDEKTGTELLKKHFPKKSA